MNRRLALLLLTAAVALVAFAPRTSRAQANPPTVDPTHYWTYQLERPFGMPTPILARDQFFLGYTPLLVDSLERLVNWVYKNNSPVRDTMIHYTWWNIATKLPMHASAILQNQFGQYPIDVFDLDFMLVPAWKNYQSPVFPIANHYLCYHAQGPPPTFGVELRDEWRTDFQYPGPLQFLCVPCWKEHNGQVFAPVDTVTHLALYPIMPQSPVFYPLISDQFLSYPQYVFQRPVEYLMVPSVKTLIPTDTKNTTWGRIKQIYR